MTARTISTIALPSGRAAAHEYPLVVAATVNWVAFRAMLARVAARRRLARRIAHLDDRLLADAGIAPEHRGLADRLVGYTAAAAKIASGTRN